MDPKVIKDLDEKKSETLRRTWKKVNKARGQLDSGRLDSDRRKTEAWSRNSQEDYIRVIVDSCCGYCRLCISSGWSA